MVLPSKQLLRNGNPDLTHQGVISDSIFRRTQKEWCIWWHHGCIIKYRSNARSTAISTQC